MNTNRPFATHPHRRALAALLLVCLLAYGLRLYQIDYFGFWQDEGLTPARAGYDLRQILRNVIVVQGVVTTDTHPPLYYLLIHLLRPLLGATDFAYRIPSALLGLPLLPLLYQLGRRLDSRRLGLLAALLAAVNPLQIWYGQEARMYTLAALLMAVAAYALWRGLTTPRVGRWLAVYTLCAALALYTHYTAVFLIGVQGLLWVWRLWQVGQRRIILAAAAAGLLAAIPLAPLTLPRLTTGAETNYFFVPLTTMLVDVVHGFGQGVTADAATLPSRLLDVFSGALLLLGLWTIGRSISADPERRRLTAAYVGAYLLTIVFSLYLLSFLKPMYQGVRHIFVGSPAFFLLLSAGLLNLPRPRLLRPLALLFILGGGTFSLLNLYRDPSFAKDDVRALIRHIEQRAAPGDLVLYNDAVSLFLHDHYAQRSDLEVTAIPTYPLPFDEREAARLDAAIAGQVRVWLVTDPPSDGRDETGVLEHLDARLLPHDEHFEHGRNQVVSVRLYGAPASPQLSALTVPPWPGGTLLRGWAPAMTTPVAAPTLWVALGWGEFAPPFDTELRFGLWGTEGQQWVDNQQPFWPPALQQWHSGTMQLQYGLPLPPGLPPGVYELRVALITGDGAEWRTLGLLPLAATDQWPLPPTQALSPRVAVRFGDAAVLQGIEQISTGVRPGHALPLIAYWQAPTPPLDLRYELALVDRNGDPLLERSGALAPAWMAAASWSPDALLRTLIGLAIPADAAPGVYDLRWRLRAGDEPISGRPPWRPWSTASVNYGSVTVEPWPLETALPPVDATSSALFGAALRLHGYTLDTAAAQPGDTLALTLVWQTEQPTDANLYVFLHLVDPAGGAIVAQQDRIPVEWLRPTNGWRQDEVLIDPYQLALPADLAAGGYDLFVGFYDPATLQRPDVVRDGAPQPDGRLLLTRIEVEP